MVSQRAAPIFIYGAGLLTFVLGVRVGLTFPDADLGVLRWMPGIDHRSMLTHGALVPILLYFVSRRYSAPVIKLGVIGFCAALAVHLSYDLFPEGYNGNWCWGYGCIYVPILGRASAFFSFLWIAGGLVVTLYLALLLVNTLLEIVLAMGGLAAGYFLMFPVEPDIAFNALLALLIAAAFVLILPSDIRRAMLEFYAKTRDRI